MRLNVNKYQELMQEQNIGKVDIERMTGMTVNTLEWIFENEYLESSTLERLADVVKCDTQEIALPDHNNIENVIEWQRDGKTATLSITQGRIISKVLKLVDKYPEQCKVIVKNKDGSVCVRIPTSWIRINPGKNLTNEQRERLADGIRRNILNADYNRNEID